MTHEQIERMLKSLDEIETALAVTADYSEKIANLFEEVTFEHDGVRYFRIMGSE